MKLALYGYGGHAREVAAQINKEITFYVDDEYANGIAKPISKFDPITHHIMIAVGNSNDRFNVTQKLPKETQYFTFIHPTALIMSKDIKIGEGSFIGAYCVLTTNIKLGKHTILNRGNHIGHDCEIGDYFSAMPGAIISGNVKIHNNVYIGTNSSIKEKLNINNSVIIGMNSCVTKNIEHPGIYVGNPVKQIK